MNLTNAFLGIAAITSHSLKKLVLSRKAVITLLVAAFVAVVTGYVGSQDVEPLAGGTDLLDTIILFFFMPVMAMIYGSSLIRDEIDDKSITHVATAPLDRGFSYIGYYIALAVTVAITMVIINTVGFLAFFAQNDLGPEAVEIWLEFTALVIIGSFVYSSLFLGVSVLFKKPVFFGLFYAFIWEGFISSFPGSIQKASVKFYLRSLGSDWLDQGAMSSFQEAIDPSAAAAVLIGLLLFFVLFGVFMFREMELS